MSHSLQPKRVPGQYHLSLFRGERYKGLPTYTHPEGLVTSYLERLFQVLLGVSNSYSKVLAVRIDLHFPSTFTPSDTDLLTNDCLQRFFKLLRARLDRSSEERLNAGLRVHYHGFEYVWARECGPDSGKPHFHLLLLFNGHAYRGVGIFAGGENLSTRISESWGEVLGIHIAEGIKYVHFADNGQYLISSGDQRQIEEVFYRASYLTKVSTKNFLERLHVFGSSRV